MTANEYVAISEPDEDASTPAQTRLDYLGWASLGYTKVRHVFVQTPPEPPKGSTPGTLAEFSRNHRAAVLYLALLANWPWLAREPEPLPADSWIRFLTCDDPKALTWTPQSLSHAWGVLEELKLIERPRKGRLINVTPRREDGKADYTSPEGKNDPYLILPNAFWTEELFGVLSWPALAVLLILLKETGLTPSAELLINRARAWYGISRTAAEEGLVELRNRALVDSVDRLVRDSKAAKGRRLASKHILLPPFSTSDRDSLRAQAQARMKQRKAAVAFDEKGDSDAEQAATA